MNSESPKTRPTFESPAGQPVGSALTPSFDVFPKPAQHVDAKYRVGDAWTFIRLGKGALKHRGRSQQTFGDYGDYGVIYDLKIDLINPDDHVRFAELAFEATAGPASGVFYIDDGLCTIRRPNSDRRRGSVW